MTPYGFMLVELRLVGPGKTPAVAQFYPGLNVIHGPSDTGKSFIFQCLDYSLGGKAPPKDIPESRGYDLVQLIIKPAGERNATRLSRSLRNGKKVEAQQLNDRGQPVGEPAILDAKHSAANEDTLSAFLLRLSGLTGRSVRKNQRGVTRTLSFRDLAQLILVDEEEILREASPIHSGQYTTATVESSVFRLLLTGRDDSDVQATEAKDITRTKREAKLELLDELMREVGQQLAVMDPTGDEPATTARVIHIAAQMQECHAALVREQSLVEEVERSRANTWRELRTAESRLRVWTELAQRFELLAEQYGSDLRRLEAMAEAGTALENIPVEACPVCGAAEQHHSPAHRAKHHDPALLADACNSEIARIQKLQRDLEGTSYRIAADIAGIEDIIPLLAEQEAMIAAEIRHRLKPRTAQIMDEYRSYMMRLEELRTVANLYTKRAELLEKRAGLETVWAEGLPTEPLRKLGASEAHPFELTVEGLLREWGFADSTRVSYSDSAEDLVISGRQRGSHGKGLRALTHAAFTLGLLAYCRTSHRPHPGLVVLDTPLNPYKQKPATDSGEVQLDVKIAFFRAVAERFATSQVVVMENTSPPGDAAFNVIEFTGGADGRFGFVPVST